MAAPGEGAWLKGLGEEESGGYVSAFTNCKGDQDIDAKRSRPSIGKPVTGHARKERVLLFGTDSADHIRASGQTAALKGRIHDRSGLERQWPNPYILL